MQEQLPYLFRIYRMALKLAVPFLHFYLYLRVWRGKEDLNRLRERRGKPTLPRQSGPLLWVHAASVGETLAALPLISRLAEDGFEILLTTVTLTSAALAEHRKGEHVTHQFMPIDTPKWLNRFIDYWRPQLAIFIEQELWPNTLHGLKQRNIPIILLNARLSEHSALRWSRSPELTAWLLRHFQLIVAQSEKDATRLQRLGAPEVQLAGNLKFDAKAPPARAIDVSTLSALLKGRPVWTAASTHEGEEEQIFSQIVQLKLLYPNLCTLLAPRHPQRADKIVHLASLYDLKVARRSKNQWPQSMVDLFLLDTIGELGLLYNISGIVFLGGSLVPHGGQNPIEPAQLNNALLYGPYVDNFLDTYNKLSAAGGAQSVRDAADLRSTLRSLLDHPDEVKIMAVRAKDAVSRLGGGLQTSMQLMQPYLEFAKRS